jgi:hypothetical protein
MHNAISFALVLAVSIFELWFWFKKVDWGHVDTCPEYGFFFYGFRLSSKGFVITNIVFYFALLPCCFGVLVGMMFKYMRAEKQNGGVLEPIR